MTCGKTVTGSFLSPSFITMADQLSSTAAKKKGGGTVKKPFRNLIKRPKSAIDSANQSNSTGVFDSSAFSTPVPGNNAGSTKATASSKYIVSLYLSAIDDDLASLQKAIRR